jgi:predicted RNase H-like nuclease
VVSGPRRGHGPQLPYRLLAGVEPCRGGWLIVVGKLLGINLLPEQALVVPTFTDALDYRPSFDVLALHAPIGLPSEPSGAGRSCDRAARKVLGWPRSGAVVSPPARAALTGATYEEARARNGGKMSVVQWQMLRRFREVDAIIGPYHQRTVFEVHPELGFHQINDDQSLQHPKHGEKGISEREAILVRRMPGVERIFDAVPSGATLENVLDACADLWTARRIASRAVHRLPEDPEWDETGLRMELLR